MYYKDEDQPLARQEHKGNQLMNFLEKLLILFSETPPRKCTYFSVEGKVT